MGANWTFILPTMTMNGAPKLFTKLLYLSDPRPAVVGDSDQAARGVPTGLDQEEHPGVGRHV